MRFIDPKTDFAFKRIFGSENSKDILMSFLNALLYPGETYITDLEIIDPYSAPKVAALKDSYLDVRARLNNQTIVLIEMQVVFAAAFEKRVVYNVAKMYANQLKKGEGYLKLNPVIGLVITDFEMFPAGNRVISKLSLYEKEQNFEYPEDTMQLVFVELPKFTKQLESLETITDKWIYFMKTAPRLDAVPDNMSSVPEINKAFGIANEANLSLEELEDLERREMFIRDQQSMFIKNQELLKALAEGINKGREEGIVRGREEGIVQGREEGIVQGREEGIVQGQAALMIRLLTRRFGEIPLEIQSRIRQLSMEVLESLAEEMLDLTNLTDLLNWLETK